MSEWREGKLKEIAEIAMGQSPKGETCNLNGIGIPLLNGPTEFGVKSPSPIQYTEDAKKLCRIDDILFCVRGSTTGKMNWANQKYAIGRGIAAIRHKEGRDFKYYLKGVIDYNITLLLNSVTGSTFPNVSKEQLENLEILIPPLPEQKAIASVLSSLDDKIDLLHRQNKTLEAMAETLFRQWFIEEGGNNGNEKFDLWISETIGGDWGKENPQDDFTAPIVCFRGTDIADLNSGLAMKIPIRYVKQKKYNNIKPNEGDLIIEISGGTENQSTGRVTYIDSLVCKLFNYPIGFSNFCRLIRVKNPNYSFFVYCYLRYLYNQDEFFNLENGSSGIKNLNYKALLFELEYPMPEEKAVLSFQNSVMGYFNKINQNKYQIQTLEKLRDTLLPKLMSGEVRVNY